MIFFLLLFKKFKKNMRKIRYYNNHLILNIRANNILEVSQVLKEFENINNNNDNRCDLNIDQAFRLACRLKHFDIIKLIIPFYNYYHLKYKIEGFINNNEFELYAWFYKNKYRNGYEERDLYYACGLKNIKLNFIIGMIDLFKDIEISLKKNNPIERACERGNFEIIKWLCENNLTSYLNFNNHFIMKMFETDQFRIFLYLFENKYLTFDDFYKFFTWKEIQYNGHLKKILNNPNQNNLIYNFLWNRGCKFISEN